MQSRRDWRRTPAINLAVIVLFIVSLSTVAGCATTVHKAAAKGDVTKVENLVSSNPANLELKTY